MSRRAAPRRIPAARSAEGRRIERKLPAIAHLLAASVLLPLTTAALLIGIGDRQRRFKAA